MGVQIDENAIFRRFHPQTNSAQKFPGILGKYPAVSLGQCPPLGLPKKNRVDFTGEGGDPEGAGKELGGDTPVGPGLHHQLGLKGAGQPCQKLLSPELAV
jgi:hypothetical protein